MNLSKHVVALFLAVLAFVAPLASQSAEHECCEPNYALTGRYYVPDEIDDFIDRFLRRRRHPITYRPRPGPYTPRDERNILIVDEVETGALARFSGGAVANMARPRQQRQFHGCTPRD
jgi:hypothetical protein